MKKPLRGHRSGPLWFLILLFIGGSVYGARIYLSVQQTAARAQESIALCQTTHQVGRWEEAVVACATALSLAPGNPTVVFALQEADANLGMASAAASTRTAANNTATAQAPVVSGTTPNATMGATVTLTSLPAATVGETPSPTATATPAVDYQQLIIDYRRAERAALQTLDDNILKQAPIFAHGEALDSILQQVEILRNAGHYQVLIVEDVQIEQVTPGAVIGVLVNERHSRQTFARNATGDRLIAQEVNNYSVVYGFVQDDGRWKVDKVRLTN